MAKTQLVLRRMSFFLFSALYIWVCYHVIFVSLPQLGRWENVIINPALLLLLVIGVCALLFFVFKLLSSLKIDSEKRGYLILIAYMAVSTVASITLGLNLRYEPTWDLGAVFYGGLEWALTGDFQSYHKYFATFPHNLPTLLIFRCLFGVYIFLGGNDYYAVAVVLAVLLLQVSVYAIYDTVRRLIDVRAGIMALFIIAIYLPFYTMGAVFYTDVLSLPFIAIAINLYLRIKTAESFKFKLIYAILFGVIVGIGTLIKTTVIIIFIACLIDWVLNNKDWKFLNIKSNILLFGASTLIIIVIMAPYTIYINSLYADQLFQHRIPTVASIYVGLTEEAGGAYTWEAARNYYSLENVDVRTEEVKRLINNQLEDFGFVGLIRHLGVKLGVAFKSGTFDQAWLIGAGPEHSTVLHETLLPTGRYFPIYNYISTALMLGMLIFAIVSALTRSLIRQLKSSGSQFCAPWVAFIGLAFFLMIFETGNRLPMNFFSLMVICAVQGLYDTRMWINSLSSPICNMEHQDRC